MNRTEKLARFFHCAPEAIPDSELVFAMEQYVDLRTAGLTEQEALAVAVLAVAQAIGSISFPDPHGM